MLNCLIAIALIGAPAEAEAAPEPIPITIPGMGISAPSSPETAPELEPEPVEAAATGTASETVSAAAAEPAAKTGTVTDAAVALAEANRLFDGGRLTKAKDSYAALIRDYRDSPEADVARRILRAWSIGERNRAAMTGGPKLTTSPDGEGSRDTVYSKEAYSLRTQERIEIGVWEKIDFGVTAFAYGASVGGSWVGAAGANDAGSIVTPIIIGSLANLGTSLLYLFLADPDRGDLPLVLGISSYVPTATMLIASLTDANGLEAAWAGAIAGTLAIPLAVLLGHFTNLDPGDTQLARDAGFWLALLSAGVATSVLWVVAEQNNGQNVDLRAVPAAALGGLVGGIGLGVLGAYYSEVSLERVRVTTWGGYGGTAIGALIGIPILTGTNGNMAGMFAAMTVGAAAGLVVGFIASDSLDELPTDVRFLDGSRVSFLEPTLLPAPGKRGESGVAFGMNLVSAQF